MTAPAAMLERAVTCASRAGDGLRWTRPQNYLSCSAELSPPRITPQS